MKKTAIFLMLISCLVVLFPIKVSATDIFCYGSNNYILTDNDTTTSSYISDDEVKKIVKTNNSICGDNSKLRKFFNEYWKIIVIVLPALVILMTSIDFFKAITSSDADRIKKSANDAFKRTLAFILLLFLPFILNTVFGWFGLPLCL